MKCDPDFIPPLSGYLSAREFANRVEKSRHTIYKYCWEGRIQAFQIARQIVIPESEIERLRK
jgi:predicted site-specific integrase-resolvase